MNRDDWKAVGVAVVDWANAHPGLVRDVTLFLLGLIVGLIL